VSQHKKQEKPKLNNFKTKEINYHLKTNFIQQREDLTSMNKKMEFNQ